MKKTIKVLCLALVLVMVFAMSFTCLIACNNDCKHEFDEDKSSETYGKCTLCGEKKCVVLGAHTWHNGECVYDETASPDFVDYVDQLKFNENSGRNWTVATVRNYVDGDTTHFNVGTDIVDTGVLKARYLAVNTPESTGVVEPYGKVASNFTKEKLSTATSVILESDNGNWNKDSTGTRYTVWVWYKPSADEDYRNLNLELLQEGLAIASNSEGNSYGEWCGNAIRQAQALKFRVFDDNVPDDSFYYGEGIALTLKELRSDITNYVGKKVSVEGVVILNSGNNGVYIEEYDDISEISFGIYAYYGFTKNTRLINILSVGNRVRVVGTVSEFNGTYQISGLDYRTLYPDDPDNTILLDKDNTYDPKWPEMSIDEFYKKHDVTVIGGDDKEDQTFTNDYAYFAQATSIYMTNLEVVSIYTTKTSGSDSRGAMSITCRQVGSDKTIVIRTGVLRDPDGRYGVPAEFLAGKPTNNTTDFFEFTVLQGYFEGKTFNVYGVVGYYSTDDDNKYGNSPYQVNVFSLANIEFVTQ